MERRGKKTGSGLGSERVPNLLTIWILAILPALLFGLERLEPEHGCYLGAYLGVDRPDSEVATTIDTFLLKAGKDHAVYHRYIPYGIPFPRAWADSVKLRNSACLISWGMPDSLAMDTCYGLQDTVFMSFVGEVKDFDGPVFIRLGWEMNGWWYGWGQCYRHYVPAFKRAARVIHDSCPNAAMVWCPNYGGGYPWANEGGHSEGDAYTVYYPADDSFHYVDWVGLDFYHNEYWGNTYTPLAAILGKPDSSIVYFCRHYCDTLGKPFQFGETSTLEWNRGNQNETLQRWWISTLYDSANLSQNWPKLKAISWFHVLKQEWMGGVYNWVDWRITDTNFPVYSQAIRSSYFLSRLDNGAVVEKGWTPDAGRDTPITTIVRGLLRLSVSPFTIHTSLFDMTGRKVMELHPGPNDVSWLAPGIYFIHLASAVGRHASNVHKVVMAR